MKLLKTLGETAKEAYKNGTSQKIPPVAAAVWEILSFYNVSLADKKVLVIGKGKLVGEPVGEMLSRNGVKYEAIDKDTEEGERLGAIKSADVIISGVGSPHFLKPDMTKEGVVLIDAGTSSDQGRLLGDIDPACAEKAGLVTPVPGGVGPLTTVCLFMNLIK